MWMYCVLSTICNALSRIQIHSSPYATQLSCPLSRRDGDPPTLDETRTLLVHASPDALVLALLLLQRGVLMLVRFVLWLVYL